MRRLLASLYAFKFFDSFILIFPLYAVMFVDAGLTPVEISIVLTCWSATSFLVDVPAGVAADRWPRRQVLALAQVPRVACFVIWWLYPHFWGFLIGLVLWGLKSGFTSGTFEALVFDELKARDRAGDYARLFGRARAVQAVAVVLASLGAAAVAGDGFGVALAASLASIVLAIGAAVAIPPAARSAETRERHYLAHLAEGLGLAVRDRAVLGILGFSALVLALGGALEEFWPIFGVKVGLTRPLIAIFVGGQQTLEAAGSLLAHRLAHVHRRWLYGLFAAAGLALAAAAALFNQPAMALLALYSGTMRLTDVAFEARLQHAIPSGNRATIGSVKGFVSQIGVSTLYLTFGPLAQATGYRTAFLAVGVTASLIGAGLVARQWTRAPKVALAER
jgi:MFS family permease